MSYSIDRQAVAELHKLDLVHWNIERHKTVRTMGFSVLIIGIVFGGMAYDLLPSPVPYERIVIGSAITALFTIWLACRPDSLLWKTATRTLDTENFSRIRGASARASLDQRRHLTISTVGVTSLIALLGLPTLMWCGSVFLMLFGFIFCACFAIAALIERVQGLTHD